MSTPHNTHRLTLGKHTEDVTKEGLEAIKKATGRHFAEYTVEDIQPEKPADVKQVAAASAPAKPAKDADKAA